MASTNPFVFLLLISASLASTAVAVEPPEVRVAEPSAVEGDTPIPPKKTELQKKIDRSLERYKVFEGKDSKPMKAVYPVLAWTNPVAGTSQKARTVLFIKDGQAKCVCCIWQGGQNLYHEFGALTRKSLRGELDDNPSWKFDEGSIKFQTIPNSGRPAEDRRRRLLQMRQLSRRFGAIEMENRQRKKDRVHLRLLTTPLYRYEKPSDQILDGALFCFADGTDPEAVLVIEAVRDKDTLSWEYAFMRRTTLPVTGQLDDVDVWSTKDVGNTGFNQIRYRQ